VAGELLYLDSSAIVKLVVPEPETKALRDFLRSWPERVSSVVARIEVERVARRIGGGAIRRARTVISRVALVELDDHVVRRAAALQPTELRTLDAIHLAAALSLGEDLGAICGYDSRLADPAASAGVEVVAPA
jgi:predicted nucleic acid-binding protein